MFDSNVHRSSFTGGESVADERAAPAERHLSGVGDTGRTNSGSVEQLHRITAVLAHELRNPLSVLRSGLDLLDGNANCDHQLKQLLQTQVEQMSRLVDDLLDTSRSVNGRLCAHRRPIDLSPIFDHALQSVREAVDHREQRIEAQIPLGPLWVNGDPQRIMQIITNLLTNASKYSDNGCEIALIVDCIADESIEIRVRDEGIGIDPNNLESVFEYFSQVKTPDSLEHSAGGLGIGLGLVRTLVQLHDGSVCAASEGVGKGSEFVVRLPCCEPPVTPSKSSASMEFALPNRILIVDDQLSNVYVLRALLAKMGIGDLRAASDGASALAELASFAPDVVLLDLGLPGMSGLDLAKEIRRLEHCRHTSLVALTGYDDDRMRVEAEAAGIDLYRVKPVSIGLLQEVLSYRRAEVVS